MEQYFYVTRDKDDTLWLHQKKTFKTNKGWLSHAPMLLLNIESFPNLKWEDEPLAVVLQQAVFKSKE